MCRWDTRRVKNWPSYIFCRYHTWYFHSLMTSAFGAKIFWRHFTRSALPLLYSWSDSPIGCSAPLYSRSGSLIRSAYYFLYISFCWRFNKSLTNLTSLHQHHLQYTVIIPLVLCPAIGAAGIDRVNFRRVPDWPQSNERQLTALHGLVGRLCGLFSTQRRAGYRCYLYDHLAKQ
jgi:hypothetical protein